MSQDCAKKKKKSLGQFYTTNVGYILQGFEISKETSLIIEPFVGNGDLLRYSAISKLENTKVKHYDIDPKIPGTIKQDTLRNPPDYTGAFVITNPPFLAKNKADISSKEIYEIYGVDDLYKCFIKSLINDGGCEGGILIVPSGFFISPRISDERLRNEFLEAFDIKRVRFFEETVFSDTSTTVVAFEFSKRPTNQKIPVIDARHITWEFFPSKSVKEFEIKKDQGWIIGGDIYDINKNESVIVSRYISGKELNQGEILTFMTLRALDGGAANNRICLEYKHGVIYQGKETSRTFATIIIKNGLVLSEEQQKLVCEKFNKIINEKREETNSLFLPQFRESKEYARKRIPFELAYNIISFIVKNLLG